MLRKYTPLFLLAIALVTYALAENVGGSGMLAVAICGLLAGNLTFRDKTEVKHFDDHLSEMLRISVFTMLGAQIMFSFTAWEFIVAFGFFLVVFFSRPLFLLPVLGRKLRSELTRRDIATLSFIAPRGLATAAIAPIVATVLIGAGQPAIAGQMLNITFLVILFSVLFSTIGALIMRGSGPLKPQEAEAYTEVLVPTEEKPQAKPAAKKKKPAKRKRKKGA
jgi:cell volume regulation protein A